MVSSRNVVLKYRADNSFCDSFSLVDTGHPRAVATLGFTGLLIRQIMEQGCCFHLQFVVIHLAANAQTNVLVILILLISCAIYCAAMLLGKSVAFLAYLV
jgi:hypothetical protein